MLKRNIFIEQGKYVPASMRELELVERKGLGHPDTLIDGIVEEISKELSRYYIKEFGKILHHNVDKGQIVGGGVEVDFGAGMFTKPIFVLLSGRATMEADGKKIPATHIALETAKRYLSDTLPNLDVKSDVEILSKIAPGSPDLVDVFLRGPKIPLSNDTSFGVGFAPFDELEQIVLKTEEYLNSKAYKKKHPYVGQDIKVMGVRQKDKIHLTVAIAFIAKQVGSINEYVEYKERIKKDIIKLTKKITKMDVDVAINSADNIKEKSVYLTLSGTSAEMGDDGSVGRGNRASGLITPMRYMSLEATAGKNPVNHVGKLYQVLAQELAGWIVHDLPEVEDVTLSLLSDIGSPIDKPKAASISLIAKKEDYKKIKKEACSIVDTGLEVITELTYAIVEGKRRIF
jgi:S-adenosylmethionine synthetase